MEVRLYNYTDWMIPRTSYMATVTISLHPELYADEYAIMTGKNWSPITFGMEIEQPDTALEEHPLCLTLPCWRDGSGPMETAIGVYEKPLDLLREFYDLTQGTPWVWVNEYGYLRRGCGSHIHIRPNFEVIKRNTNLRNYAEIWAIVWNTILDLSYVMLPMLIWGRWPRSSAVRWATPWPRSGGSQIPHLWGRRSDQTMHRYVVACESWSSDCVYDVIRWMKHVDHYHYFALTGMLSDVGNKPVTGELRIAEVHPLFAASFLKVALRIVRLRLQAGSSAKIVERVVLYDAVLRVLERRGDVREVWQSTGPITFVPGRSFWPDWLREPREKYHFENLWELFKALIRGSIANKGTPYYRAARFVLKGCDHRAEAEETHGASFWEAIVAPPGQFRWRTCDVSTG